MKSIDKIDGLKSFKEAEQTLKRFYETMELVRRYSPKPNTKPKKYEMWEY
ncbi:hypothetical protein HYT23_06235 [Candidatus Pacearchaeota archaeon]|nr:hypothetical protein [Candidatus Pacearchaeota archaeon]